MSKKPTMIVTIWGCRGSIPTPLTSEQILEKQVALVERMLTDGGTQKLFGKKADETDIRTYLEGLPPSLTGTYGGDTTCLGIEADSCPLIILDAGTGIRHLGRQLLERMLTRAPLNPLASDEKTRRELHMFFTHFHWDHLQGFPFFAPSFMGGQNRINVHLYGKRNAQQRISGVLAGQQECPNFPVAWDDLPCTRIDHELRRMEREPIKIGKATVTYTELTHPDSVFAYAVECRGKKFTFATDTEHKDIVDTRLTTLARGSQYLYYDSQYTPDEYHGRKGSLTGITPKFDWGHSTYAWAIRSALAADVPTVLLGHHEPTRDDFQLEELLAKALKERDRQLNLPENRGKALEVMLARQGMKLILE